MRGGEDCTGGMNRTGTKGRPVGGHCGQNALLNGCQAAHPFEWLELRHVRGWMPGTSLRVARSCGVLPLRHAQGQNDGVLWGRAIGGWPKALRPYGGDERKGECGWAEAGEGIAAGWWPGAGVAR